MHKLQLTASLWSAVLPLSDRCIAARRFAETGVVASALERGAVAAFAGVDCLPLVHEALQRDPDNTRLAHHLKELTAFQQAVIDLPIRPPMKSEGRIAA